MQPDPQAFRPPEEDFNVLHVGLPTNFKLLISAIEHSRKLHQLADDIAAVTVDGKDVPVKLRVHDSLFVPMAKWSMLLTGNYRCVLADDVQSIHDAVHGDLEEARELYAWVDELARKLGADAADQVPFEKYANAALSLLKPSSAARAIASGADRIERVDRLVRTIGNNLGMHNAAVDKGVKNVDARLAKMPKPVFQRPVDRSPSSNDPDKKGGIIDTAFFCLCEDLAVQQANKCFPEFGR